MKKPNKILSFLVALSMITTSMVGLASVSYAEGEEAPIAVEDNLVVDGVETPELEAAAEESIYEQNYDGLDNGADEGFVKSGNPTIGVSPKGDGSWSGDATDKYLKYATGKEPNTKGVKTFEKAYSGKIVLSFDWNAGNSTGKDANYNGISFMDSSDRTIFDVREYGQTKKFEVVNDTEYAGTGMRGATYHVEAEINFNTKQVENISITSTGGSQGGTVEYTSAAVPFIDESAGDVNKMQIIWNRAGGGNDSWQGLDNVSIKQVATRDITFTVTDMSDQPIQGATVTGISPEAMQTDENGQLAQIALADGKHTAHIVKENYIDKDFEFTVAENDVSFTAKLEQKDAPVATRIEIAGGQEYVYTPIGATANVALPFTATVFDQNGDGYPMPDETVSWSIDPPVAGVSIDTAGVVSVDNTVTGFEGEDGVLKATIVATSDSQSGVTAETELTIRNKQIPKDWSVAGSYAIKAGTSETFTIENVINQYGEEYPGYADENHVISLALKTPAAEEETPLLTFDGVKATAGTISTDVEKVKVVSKCGSVQKNHEFVVWGNDTKFYEAGISKTAFSADARFEKDTRFKDDAGEGTMTDSVLVWPKSTATAGASSTLTLDQAQVVEAGKAIELSWKMAWTEQLNVAQLRALDIQDSNGNSVLKEGRLNLCSNKMGFQASKDSNGNYQNAIELGTIGEEGIWVDCALVVKKAVGENGVLAGEITINGQKTAVEINSGTISKIVLNTDKGAPDTRLLGIKDIAIKDVEVPDFEFITKGLLNDKEVARVSNQEIIRDYEVSVFGKMEDGEVLTWTVESADENAPVITKNADDQTKAQLLIKDTTTPGTYTIKATSSDTNKQPGTIEVVVQDFANIDFWVFGPVAFETGKSGNYTYKIDHLFDEYGDPVTFAPVWAVTPADQGVTIDAATGELTITDQAYGDYAITATMGNPGKEKVVTYNIKVVAYTYQADVTDNSTEVDVSGLVTYGQDTDYQVTLLMTDGTSKTETKTATDNKIVVNTTGAAKIEVSSNFKFDLGTGAQESGYISAGARELFDGNKGYGFTDYVEDTENPDKQGDYQGTRPENGSGSGTNLAQDFVSLGLETFDVALPDGTYTFVFTKGESGRSNIFVNNVLAGMNVGMYGQDPTIGVPVGIRHEFKYMTVEGGRASISMNQQSTALAGVEIRRVSDLEQKQKQIFIAGDSTVCNYYVSPDGEPQPGKDQAGWAQLLPKYLSEDIVVNNLACSGDYAANWKTYAFSSVTQNAQPGDYFIIQFGINDRSYPEGTSSSEKKEIMRKALTEMIQECKAKGIIPVLVTPQKSVGYAWYSEADGKVSWSDYGGHTGIVKEVAEAEDTLLIDLAQMSADLFYKLGRTYVRDNYHLKAEIAKDGGNGGKCMHFSYLGAKKLAELVATSIYDQQLKNTRDGKGNDFEGIILNDLTQYNFTYTNEAGESKTEQVTAVGFGEVTPYVPTIEQGAALDQSLNISTPAIEGGKVKVTVANNMFITDQEASLIVADYDENGVMTGVRMMTQSIPSQGQVELSVDASTAANSQVLIWDTADGVRPLTGVSAE